MGMGFSGRLKIVKIKKKKLNLQVLYTNADGLLNKKCELNLLINRLEVKPDIIAITEIWNQTKKTHRLWASEFQLDRYIVFCQGLEDNSKRGLLFYTASGIEMSVVDMPETFHECLFLLLKSSNQGLVNKFLLGNIYCSPSSSLINDKNL